MKNIVFKDMPTVDFMLRTSWNAVVKAYNQEAAKHDFTMVMAFALLSIDPKDGTPSTLLGPKMGMEPTSLSRTLKNLEERELIKRHPNPDDGRGVIIRLTPYGLQHRETSKSVVLQFNEVILEHVGEEALQTFVEVCLKIQKLTSNNEIFKK